MKNSSTTHLLIGFAALLPCFLQANTYTFTSADVTGSAGPTQGEVDSNYSGTNLAGAVTINTQGIQEWSVPASGSYSIEVFGAQGGNNNWATGGKGARMKGTFSLDSGNLLKIVVGAQGSSSSTYRAGGGGGTFVWLNGASQPLIVAGGGGGGGTGTNSNGIENGQTGTDGEAGFKEPDAWSPGVGGAGGTNGSGGQAGVGGNHLGHSGGGAGWLSSGGGTYPGLSKFDFTGGEGKTHGGFGGGGGVDNSGAGGGGGYSGGGGSGWGTSSPNANAPAGGGGSYNSGTDQNNTAGANEGHGKVIITLLQPTTYVFTSAGATGRYGPTQSQIDANYSGTNLEGAVTINTQGIQEWTVPTDGNYSIEAWGAQGANNRADLAGAFGAKMQGTFSLDSGTSIKILVGQKGTDSTNSVNSSAGGGGTFVTLSDNTPLIVAGGGGGRGATGNQPGVVGTTDQNGTMDSGGNGQPGANGQGGISGSISNVNGGGGGGGLLGDGLAKKSNSGYPGLAFVNGGTGGSSRDGYSFGGFGGGGGNHETNGGGGGGGGYSGGTGGQSQGGYFGGGGGGSYNSGTDQSNTAGANEGHGKVIITLYSSSSNPSQSPVITQGAGPLSKTIDEDTNATWTASELNATDSDTQASSLAWSLLTSPTNGTATVSGNGSAPTTLSYQPNGDYHGADSFSVQVTDGENNDSITINLTISQVDDATSVSGDTQASIAEDTSASGDLNATDADGLTDGSYFSVSTPPANGSASIDPANGNWTYSPNPDFFGSDYFEVSVTDDQGASSTTTIHLTISPVDDATSVSGDTQASIAEDTSASGDLNATDADGLTDGSYFSISAVPANGSASIDPADGNWTYSPNPNFFGSDSFGVSTTDDQGASSTTTIHLTISPVDDATSVSGDTQASISEDTSASGDLNATDADGLTDGSYFSISTVPANGSASIDPANGNWTYSPNPDFFGSDSFGVSTTDDQGASSTTTIHLTISPVDDATSVSGDTQASIAEDTSASGDLNATDADGLTDGSYFSISTVPANGSASIDPADGNWTYSPNPDFFGSDSFEVSITDDQGASSTTTVNLSISAVDDATTVSGDTQASIAEDTSASGDLNATDADGLTDGSLFSISTPPTNGSASIDPADGNWTYSPNPNFFGSDSFEVSVTDDQGASSTTTIHLSVSPVDDPTQVTGELVVTLAENESASGDLNATDADGLTDGSLFSISTPPTNGSASIDPTDGNWTYSPKPYYYGSDSFVVSVTDDFNVSTTLSIDLNVTEVIEYYAPVVETGEPGVDSAGTLSLSGSVLSDGGKALTEVGFLLSSTLDFNQSERLAANPGSASGEFTVSSSTGSARFVRAYASNEVGESLGQVMAIEAPSPEPSYRADAQSLPDGWLQSDWLGTFQPQDNGWIFHARLGWLYAPDSGGDGIWLWSPTEGWLWTQEGVAPHFYDHGSSNWLYLLPAGEHGMTFYDYAIEDVR